MPTRQRTAGVEEEVSRQHQRGLQAIGFNSNFSCAQISYHSNEAPELIIDTTKLQRMATTMLGTKCTRVQKLSRGGYHELYVLYFDQKPGISPSGQEYTSCIARFPRDTSESWEKVMSEIATMEFVRKNTKIPVPEILHTHLSCSGEDCVGARFVLLERVAGRSLDRLWWDLPFEHKKAVISQVAGVVAALGSLEFDKIGSLMDVDGNLGEIVHAALNNKIFRDKTNSRGPFKTIEEYLYCFIDESDPQWAFDEHKTEGGRALSNPTLDLIKYNIARWIRSHNFESIRPPYGLMHNDLDIQNIMFEYDPISGNPPRLTAVIDWEHAQTEPRYFIYKFPPFIRDGNQSNSNHHDNIRLRRHFLSQLLRRFRHSPKDRKAVKNAFREKSFVLGMFKEVFVWPDEAQLKEGNIQSILQYSEALVNGSAGYNNYNYQPEEWVMRLVKREASAQLQFDKNVWWLLNWVSKWKKPRLFLGFLGFSFLLAMRTKLRRLGSLVGEFRRGISGTPHL